MIKNTSWYPFAVNLHAPEHEDFPRFVPRPGRKMEYSSPLAAIYHLHRAPLDTKRQWIPGPSLIIHVRT